MGALAVEMVPVTGFQQNCTLVYDTGSRIGVVVDPGGEWGKISAAISRLGLNIQAIWLTHGHVDHAGAAATAKTALSVQIIGPHRAEAELLRSLPLQADYFGFGEAVLPFVPDHWLSDGEQLYIGEHQFSVLHLPGHTPGHVGFYAAKAKLVLLGDVLFCGSIGRTDFPYSDPIAMQHSLAEKILPLPDDVVFYCGHGPKGSIGAERASNPFLRQWVRGRAADN